MARPSDGVHRRSALRVTYDAFGSERYVLAFDNRRLREAAAAAPYDAMVLVVNGRKYGGGGIFNLYATVASDNAFTPYVFVHEFGHHFAGLADEYYTSDVAYESTAARPEPWELNATASATAPKWADLVTPGTPLPTPWAKEAFEEAQKEIQARRRRIRAEGRPEEEMEALFREEQERVDALLARGEHSGGGGGLRGGDVRGPGLLPPPGQLHDVHADHGVLRGLPPRPRAGDRPLLPTCSGLECVGRRCGLPRTRDGQGCGGRAPARTLLHLEAVGPAAGWPTAAAPPADRTGRGGRQRTRQYRPLGAIMTLL